MQFLIPQGEIEANKLMLIKIRQFLQFFHFCNFCHPKVRLILNMQLLPAFGPRFDGMVVFKSNNCNIRDAFISGRQEKLVYVPCIIGKVLFARLDH